MTELSVVGQSIPRIDAFEKATGRTKYSVDLKVPGMLYGKLLRSPYPHARILSVDTSRAVKVPGVKAVVTGKDGPAEKFGAFARERNIFAVDEVRFVAEPVAGVAAESMEAAEEAVALIKVEYEQLPAIFDPEEAMKPNPQVVVHPDFAQYRRAPLPPAYLLPGVAGSPNIYTYRLVTKGDLEQGFKDADLVVENRYACARIHQGPLESLVALAQWESDGSLTVHTANIMGFAARATAAQLFGLPPSRVRIIVPPVGGSFGSRAEAHQILQAAVLAQKARRPVKLVLTREEFLQDGGNREPLITYIKDGVKKDGTLVARHIKIIVHSGAYCGLTAVVCRSATYGASATYRIPNFRIDSYTVATNEPPSVPFRGFGSTQVQWAIENQMDFLARKLEIDPTAIRRKNFLHEGEEDGCGMPVHSIGVEDCMDKVGKWVDWGQPPAAPGRGGAKEEGAWVRGKGIATANRMVTGGTTSIMLIKVHEDAAIEVRHSVVDQGQGAHTVLCQVAAEEFKTTVDKVRLVGLDTARTYYEFGTVGSRSTMQSGNALRLACQDAKRQLCDLASGKLGVAPELLEVANGTIYVRGVPERAVKVSELFTPLGYLIKGGELIGRGVYTGPVAVENIETGQCKRPVMGYSYGATSAEVAVNTETGEVKVLRMADCFDMGQPMSPKACEGQIEGGRVMALGSALSEEVVVRQGKVVTPSFMDYKMPTALDGPRNDQVSVSIVPDHPHRDGPYGAKGFSEGVMVPQSPAVASAIFHAVGVRVKDIPITKEKVLQEIKKQNSKG